MKRPSRLLIFSSDPVVAALLGMLADLAGYAPEFAGPGERPEEALARVNPVFVVLVDGALEMVRSDLFFAQAAKLRAGIAVFHPPGREPALADSARRRRVPCAVVPRSLDEFRKLIEVASGSTWWRTGTDRRAGETTRELDGTLIFVDADGRRWRVLDRRGSERRARDDDTAERFFIGDHGEIRRYQLESEDTDESVEVLARQLAEAERA